LLDIWPGKEGTLLMAFLKRSRTFLALAMLGAFAGLMGGWSCSRENPQDDYFIRINDFSLSLTEYNQAVEAAREEAFPGERDLGIEVMNDLRLRVLNQLSEEMMITAFARDHQISVSVEELDKAVEDVKSDYPDNTFEETLLENAVSFKYWKEKLATRLLIKKVIDTELIEKVQITTDDVADYYKTHYPEGVAPDEDADAVNRRIVRHLRQQKAELAYKEWIESLRQSYPVDINKKLWERVTANPD
jgi:hypothetical protein